MASLFSFTILVVGIFTHSAILKDVDYDMELERIVPIPGDEETEMEFSNLRVMKKYKQYFLNGTFTLTKNIDNSYIFTSQALHSPMMNSRFVQTPFRIPPMPFCEFMNTIYKDKIQPGVIGQTDFILIPEEEICPIPEGTYYVKDLQLPDDFLPPHMPSGMWRFEPRFLLETRCIGGFSVWAKFTPKK